MKVVVFRLGHRYVRDDRTTTHLFLAARAFGADAAVYCGQRDEELEKTLKKVGASWGGDFTVGFTRDWRSGLQEYKGNGSEIVHLTMYGSPIPEVVEQIRSSSKDKLVVVGGAKVPKDVYDLADWNVSVTSQPHSEVSALSVFLHEFFGGEELFRPFDGGRLRIVPQKRGKRVLRMSAS